MLFNTRQVVKEYRSAKYHTDCSKCKWCHNDDVIARKLTAGTRE